ncbi:MAG: KpsF/GutQ family sugar-phosphate isomerase [Bacteroidetes bacterium]|nr:KpsF/GutQ family sugar-phosphate isomerase [Bacteroidota bacterium]
MKNFSQIIETAQRTIVNEAKTIENLASFIDDEFAQIVNIILASKGRLVITGIGKSANIATKIVATLNSTGTPSLFMHASDAIHGDLGMIQTDDIIVCISKSGNTPEIKVLLPLLKRGKNCVIAMVSERNSYLAEHADYVLYAHADREACPHNLAPTNSTTAQLVMGDALAMCLLEQRRFSSEDFAKYHPGGALGKRMYLRVSDLHSVEKSPKVLPSQSITDVIIEISSKRMGVTAVVNEQNEVLGVITDGDLRRMLEKTTAIDTLCAQDIMTKNPKSITLDDMAITAFEIMEKNKITQLVIADGSQYVGMVHLHDLLKEGIV